MCFTTVSIYHTLDANFKELDDTTGIVMLLDTEANPSGGFYVLDTEANNTITTHPSDGSPLLLHSGKHSVLPIAYAEHKIIIKVSTTKTWQTASMHE